MEEVQPFIEFVKEDKSKYPAASTAGYLDLDGDFLIGDSGGILMNINFIFINTHEFTEVARFYEVNKCYTLAIKGTREYNQFWKRETERRKNGMTANCKLYYKDIDEYFNITTTEERKKELLQPLRITGDHYNYLNYGRIMRTRSEEEIRSNPNAKIKLVEGYNKV